jgi:hypothetical protein
MQDNNAKLWGTLMSTRAYEADFYRWATETARALREGRFADVDLEHVAEEIEDLGKSERRELVNGLAVLLAHLLKLARQPGHRGNSWRAAVRDQRMELADLLGESPRLRRELAASLGRVYPRAIQKAVRDTGLPESTFPPDCPFTVAQALDPEFWPDE